MTDTTVDPFMEGALMRLSKEDLVYAVTALRALVKTLEARRIQSDRERGAAHVDAQLRQPR